MATLIDSYPNARDPSSPLDIQPVKKSDKPKAEPATA